MASSDHTAIARLRTSDPDCIPGYHLETLIGKGGMGEVYKATQLSLDRSVAIKLLNPELAKDEAFVARFEKEGAALASLSHPNIVSIVDKGKKRDLYFLVMEFVNGPSLREVLRDGNLLWPQALKIVLDICRAIEHAHRRGIIHRDLKPENILFDDNAGSIAKVSDFGLAGFVKGEGEKRFALTETNVSMGTVAYMAPEQQVDAKAVDGRADIYSIGVMLYELLSGEVPRGNFDPPSVRRPGIDRRVDSIVARCLKASPDDRFQTAAELIAELEPLVVQNTTLPRPRMSPFERAVHALARAGRALVRVAAVLLVLAAIGVLAVGAVRARTARPGAWDLRARAAALDLDTPRLIQVPGRLGGADGERKLTLGDGADQIPVVALGRPLRLDGDALAFGPDPFDSSPGRATPEVADLVGAEAVLSVEIAVPEAPSRGLFERFRDLVLDTPPEPRSAVLLQGSAGRYLAMIVGRRGERVALEWSLGEKQGAMLGPEIGDKPVRVQMAIDRDGDLRGLAWEEGGAKKPVGEPLRFGSGWKDLLGATPKPAVACLAGACRFRRFSYVADREEPKREPVPPPAAAAAPAKPAETAVRVEAPKPVAKVEPPKPAPVKEAPKVVAPKPAPKPVAKKPEPKRPEPVKASPKKAEPSKKATATAPTRRK